MVWLEHRTCRLIPHCQSRCLRYSSNVCLLQTCEVGLSERVVEPFAWSTQGVTHTFKILHGAFVIQRPLGSPYHLHHLVLTDLIATSLVSGVPLLLLYRVRAGWSFAHDEGHVEVQQLVCSGRSVHEWRPVRRRTVATSPPMSLLLPPLVLCPGRLRFPWPATHLPTVATRRATDLTSNASFVS